MSTNHFAKTPFWWVCACVRHLWFVHLPNWHFPLYLPPLQRPRHVHSIQFPTLKIWQYSVTWQVHRKSQKDDNANKVSNGKTNKATWGRGGRNGGGCDGGKRDRRDRPMSLLWSEAVIDYAYAIYDTLDLCFPATNTNKSKTTMKMKTDNFDCDHDTVREGVKSCMKSVRSTTASASASASYLFFLLVRPPRSQILLIMGWCSSIPEHRLWIPLDSGPIV